jgi:hypothetical protein
VPVHLPDCLCGAGSPLARSTFRFANLANQASAVAMAPWALEILHVLGNFFRLEDFPNQNESMDDLADALGVFVTIGDAGMWNACCMEAEVISILSKKHSCCARL